MKRLFRLLTLCVLVVLLVQNTAPARGDYPVGKEPPPGDSPQDAPLALNTPQSAPVPADDDTFLADTGGDLDIYLFRADRPDGKLRFNIPITRYFFNTADASEHIAFDASGLLTSASVEHVLSKKILPATFKLSLRVYDVDEYASGCGEVDYVYVNGTILTIGGIPKKLSGADETWSSYSFDVPVSLLKFPQSKGNYTAPTPALNEIAVEIDAALCDAWAVTVDYGILEVKGPVRPLVFAHGWTGTTDTFSYVEGKLKEDGIPNAGHADLLRGIYPISSTALILNNYIQQKALEFGVNKVNLFAHSKGGLVARYALYDAGGAKYVEHVVTYDSPHHGTIWAESLDLMIAACLAKFPFDPYDAILCTAATQEFTTSYVRGAYNYKNCSYNLFTGWSGCVPLNKQAPGVEYFSLAATGLSAFVVVPNASTAYPWVSQVMPMPWFFDPADVNAYYNTDHGGILALQEAYRCAIHLVDNSRYSCTTATAAPEAAAEALPPYQLIGSGSHTFAAAGIYTTTMSVDSGTSVAFDLYAQSPASLILEEPGGRAITPALAEVDPLISYTEDSIYDLPHYRYLIDEAVVGSWKLQVQSPTANQVVVQGLTSSLRSLELQADKPAYQPGDLATLTAALMEAGSVLLGGVVTGEVLTPEAASYPVSFSDSGTGGDLVPGDGIFTAQLVVPDYQGNLALEAQAVLGSTVRQASLLLPVSTQTAAIVGVSSEWTTDDDADGLIDTLQLEVDVQVLQSGHFDLSAGLLDSHGDLVQTANFASRNLFTEALIPGIYSFRLEFDGETIYNHGIDGPFELSGVQLLDSTYQLLEVDAADNVYTTQAYTYDSFEHPDIVASVIGETPLDFEPDGRYDQLDITLRVAVTPGGSYIVNGRLVSPLGEDLGWASAAFYTASSGLFFPLLSFDGFLIGSSGDDGPYTLTDVSIYNLEGTAFTTYQDLYTTSAYSFTEFEGGYYFTYLPLVITTLEPPPTVRMFGTVTNQGAPAPGEEINLFFDDGLDWKYFASTVTDASGNYAFEDLPMLALNQYYEVTWNTADYAVEKLAYFGCWAVAEGDLTLNESRCDFDIQGVRLINPPPGAVINLPYTFQWQRRLETSDSYELDLRTEGSIWWWTDMLGYVGEYTLTEIPVGFTPGEPNYWFIWLYNAAGYGYSAEEFLFYFEGIP